MKGCDESRKFRYETARNSVPSRSSNKEPVRIGYEIEKGLEIGLVFSFVKLVIEGALLGTLLVLFFLFDEQSGG